MYNNFQTNPYMPYGYQQKPTFNMPNDNAAVPSYGLETGLPQNYLKCRPVSSIEEARAAQIDLDGSLFVFPDIANQKIYTKQINPDGTASLNIYSLSKDVPPAESQYVTREELESTLAAFRSTLLSAEPKAEPMPAPAKPKFNL